MLSKKLGGIFASAIMTVSMLSFGSSFAYAVEEVHKHSEKALAPEHIIIVEEEFICPSCKEVRTSPEKGRTLALMTMVCPDCKNEIGEFSVHHCDKCGIDVLVCPKCKAAATELKAATMEGKCPKCKQVRRRPIKGKALAGWEMKCPDCKKKTKEMLIQHCDECGAEFLVCPICLKEQEKAKK